MIVVENKKVITYLKKRNIAPQYLKAKNNILNNNFNAVDLKKGSLTLMKFGILELQKNIVHSQKE